jgi:hypothetical protein
MTRRELLASTLTSLIGASVRARVAAQAPTQTPDLGALADRNALAVFNRTPKRITEVGRSGLRLSEHEGDGVAYVPGIDLASGTIEIDIRGKDIVQQSFVGVAFHGVDSTTYDAVYFRPFNFKAADPVARSHAVQYHSMPTFTWQKLRSEQPGKYEQAVNPVPDPNGWFRARLVIAGPTVRVFVNAAADPCLTVNLLNDRKKGLVGLWTGNNSGGDFANLTITGAA